MKRNIILLVLLLGLSGCSTTQDPDPIVDDNEDHPKEDVMSTECNHTTDVVSIDATDTLDAMTIWNHSIACEGLQYQDNTITYQDDTTEGFVQTGVFHIPTFVELVPTWNILIDEDVKVRIKLIPSDDTTIDPLMMGYWTKDYKMSLSNQVNDFGRISIDTFLPTEPMNHVSFLIEFEGGSFTFQNLSITTKSSTGTFDGTLSVLDEVDVMVPSKQQLSVPTIGNSICSPTSLAMVLSYYQHDLEAATSAANVYDEGPGIYGNWTFNASYAGGYEDLYSRVEYIHSLSTMVNYLRAGTPLILSIKTMSSSELTGSIMAYPSGHLIVLRGFEQVDGQWFALVNDPAEYTDEAVLRHYPIEQLLTAMRGYAYIIQDTPFSSPRYFIPTP